MGEMDSREVCEPSFILYFSTHFLIISMYYVLCCLSSGRGDFMTRCALLVPQSHSSVPWSPPSRQGCEQATQLDFLYSPVPTEQPTRLSAFSCTLATPVPCPSLPAALPLPPSLRRTALLDCYQAVLLKTEESFHLPGTDAYSVRHLKVPLTVLANMWTPHSSHPGQSGYYSLNTLNTAHRCACPHAFYCLCHLLN